MKIRNRKKSNVLDSKQGNISLDIRKNLLKNTKSNLHKEDKEVMQLKHIYILTLVW